MNLEHRLRKIEEKVYNNRKFITNESEDELVYWVSGTKFSDNIKNAFKFIDPDSINKMGYTTEYMERVMKRNKNLFVVPYVGEILRGQKYVVLAKNKPVSFSEFPWSNLGEFEEFLQKSISKVWVSATPNTIESAVNRNSKKFFDNLKDYF